MVLGISNQSALFQHSVNFYWPEWPLPFNYLVFGKKFEPTLAIICYRTNFYCSKWPNIEQIISPSGHAGLDILLMRIV